MTRMKGIFLSLLWNNLLKVSCTFFTDLATSKSAWSLSVDVLCTGSILDFSIDSLAKIKLFARYMGWCLGACGAASLRNDESCCYKHCQIYLALLCWRYENTWICIPVPHVMLVTTIPYYQWWRVFFGPAYLFWHIKSLFLDCINLKSIILTKCFSSLYLMCK